LRRVDDLAGAIEIEMGGRCDFESSGRRANNLLGAFDHRFVNDTAFESSMRMQPNPGKTVPLRITRSELGHKLHPEAVAAENEKRVSRNVIGDSWNEKSVPFCEANCRVTYRELQPPGRVR
jgi:hypothetical protein